MTVMAVESRGLVKSFGDFRAVDGVDLEVRQGEIFGVLGPNGAGKTTMLRMLATLLPIDAGEAHVFGVDVAREPHRVRQLVGVTRQYASVDEDLTATEARSSHPGRDAARRSPQAQRGGRADGRPRRPAPATARPPAGSAQGSWGESRNSLAAPAAPRRQVVPVAVCVEDEPLL